MLVTNNLASCPVVELRRYTLHPGTLPDLLAVFERHLVEPQEEAGMALGGTFVDEDDPDSFTWLRGFAGHDERVRALAAFYGGPVWARHRDAANATMVDITDVFLLRPTEPAHLLGPAGPRGGPDDAPRPDRVLVGTFGLDAGAEAAEDWWATDGHAALADLFGTRVATWRTDPTPNGFPALPVRAERALVWLAVFPDDAARAGALAQLDGAGVERELGRRTTWRRIARLAPTARSAHPKAEPPPPRPSAAG